MAWGCFCASSGCSDGEAESLLTGEVSWVSKVFKRDHVDHVPGCCVVAAEKPDLLIAGASWIDPCLHLLLTLVFA